MSTVDRGAPREQTANDAICVHVSTTRTRGMSWGVAVCACACVECARRGDTNGALPQNYKNEWNKWKNHFYEMKGEVGMLWHEKERQQEVAYTKTESNS